MLCQACSDMLNLKSARWKGSYKATFGSGDGTNQPTSTEPTLVEGDEHFDSEVPGGFVHHRSGRAFLAAAHDGCQLCLLFVSQLSPEKIRFIAEEPEYDDTSSARYDYVTGYGLRRLAQNRLTVKYTPLSLGNKLGPIRFYATFVPSKDQEPLAGPDISYPKVVGQGEKALSLVRQWIAACEEHTLCRLRSLSDVYQTRGRPRFARIIDVQDGSTDPRLSDVCEVPADVLYMTLSHCWGDPKHKPLTLTLDTLAAMKIGIPWKKLPKTFADAIVFTRNMGVQYIWIDSLCIIQDCTDDWASQSAAMCEIYSGSYLNLAATGAVDSRGGLFWERDERSVQPLRVARLSSSNGVVRYYDVMDSYLWAREVESAPLCRRGWVVQERALARRCLHFGKRQLHWECSTMEANESVPLGYDFSERGPLILPPSMSLRFKASDPFMIDKMSRAGNMWPWTEHDNGHVVVLIWQKLVMVYTQGGLTKETDKLVAISGLAKALAAQSSIRYLAGLWSYDLVQQLLWLTEFPSKRPDVFRAPSWSWASTNSQIYWTWEGAKAITILGAPPSGSFTTFTSSPLTIRGALIPGMLYGEESHWLGYRRVVIARKHPISSMGPHQPPWSGSFTADSDFEQDNLGPVLLLPVAIEVKAAKFQLYNQYDVGFTGLVLKTTGVKGTLRRVGRCGFSPRPSGGETPLRNIWLLDHHIVQHLDTPLPSAMPTDHVYVPSETDHLEGVTEDMYHHYEEIGNLDDRLQSISEEEAGWTHVLSGGFTFDLV